MIGLLKLFVNRIRKDFMYKDLMPLKFIFFIHASTILVLYPYLTIHMRELGINVEETAVMSAVIPVVAIVMPPLAGMLADKIGNFRLLLAIFSTLVGPVALLLLAVPVGRLTITYPSTVIMDLSCTDNGTISLATFGENYSCESAHPFQYDIDVRIETCGLGCKVEDATQRSTILQSHDISIIENIRDHGVSLSNSFAYPTLNLQPEDALSESKRSRTLKNMEHYKDTIRLLSSNTVFFPVSNYNIDCQKNLNKRVECSFKENAKIKADTKMVMKIIPQMNESIIDSEQRVKRYPVTSVAAKKDLLHIGSICKVEQQLQKTVLVTTANHTHINVGNCSRRCVLTTSRAGMCSNLSEVKELNIRLTFWSYLAIRVLVGIIGGTAFAMFEGAVIAILREHKADYGLQRVYGTLGGMISSPLSGWLIDWASQGKGYTDFRPAFWLYAGLKVTTGFLILLIRLDFKTPAKNVVGDVKTVLKNPEMIALLLACFVMGTAWGYIETFLFWLLQDLGGSRSLMGVTMTVGGMFGIPLLVVSGPVITRLGHANVIFIGFIFYAIRLLGYSLIYNPWLCLIFEAMESVTSGLAFTAAVTYAAKLSTTTTDTSIQGLLGGLYFGVGKGAGSLFGGFMISAIGTRQTYQVFSVVTAGTGLIYVFFNHFYLRKRAIEGNDIRKKEPKAEKEQENIDKPPIADKIENIVPKIDITSAEKSVQFTNEPNGCIEDGLKQNGRSKLEAVDNQAFETDTNDIDTINVPEICAAKVNLGFENESGDNKADREVSMSKQI